MIAQQTRYLGAVTLPDGYAGDEITIHLLEDDATPDILGISVHGVYRIPADCWLTSRERAALIGEGAA